jgi:hypothetical protein
VLLVVAHTMNARQDLRNACTRHPEVVVRRFGRAVFLAETELGAFLALTLRDRHAGGVQVERTRPLDASDVPERVHDAVATFAARDHPNTPYATIAARDDLPSTDTLHDADL